MSKVFLRVYNHEIESMIEGGQLNEAIAHCQHILKTFPMHVETYRLLGKAFLEARRYGDAADIFQRALMAVPDDFVSHVGMSIIRDDEGKLDEAIWHMERAFEIQPSNSAIQGELRRLYGRRDGVEPTKIRLTRDALANMYSQGELYNQAIAEIRSVLADDPNRPDLQVMLARAYFRSGQKVEAAEMAATLLKKYPFCLDSLRVLVEVLPGNSRSENTQVYRQRLRLLDPYSSFVADSVFTSDQVVDSAVTLERLDYRTGPLTAGSQPDWASSLGIKLNPEKHAETPPEWIQTSEAPGHPQSPEEEEAGSDEKSAGQSAEEAVPEWMRSAGWKETSETEPNEMAESEDAKSEETIAKADIPDWLKSMAPAEITDEEPSSEEPTEESTYPLPVGDDGIPEWLKSATPIVNSSEQGAGGIQPGEESQSLFGEDVPEWFKSMSPNDIDAEEGGDALLHPAEAQETDEENVPVIPEPSMSQDSDESRVEDSELTPVPEPVVGEDIPDWLKSMASEGVDQTPSAEENLPAVEPVESASSSENPDWLDYESSVEPSQPASTDETQPPNEPRKATNEEELPDWLQSLATSDQEQPASEPESFNQHGNGKPGEDANIPDWLKQVPGNEGAREELASDLLPAAQAEPAGETSPDWSQAEPSSQELPIPEISAETVEESSSVAQSSDEQIPVEQAPAEAERFPDWLTEMGARATAAGVMASLASDDENQPASEEQSVPEQPVDEQNAAVEPVEAESNLTNGVAEGPFIEQPTPAEPESLEAGAIDPTNLTPIQVDEQADSFRPSGEVKPLEIGDDALGWLEGLAAKQGAKPEELLTTPEDRSEEMPDWLRPSGETSEQIPSTPSPIQENVHMPAGTLPLDSSDWINEIPVAKPTDTVDESVPKQEHSIPVEPVEAPGKPKNPPEESEDETMAWLEQLSSDQESKVEEPEFPSEEKPADIPDRVQEVVDEEPADSDLNETKLVPPERPADDITITSWLTKKGVAERLAKNSIEEGPSSEEVEPEGDLPDWLKDLEKPVTPAEIPEPEAELPDWLRDSSLPATSELPSESEQQESGFGALGGMDEQSAEADQPAATMPDEWVPAEGEEPESGEVASRLEAVSAVEPESLSEPEVAAHPAPVDENASLPESLPPVEFAAPVKPVVTPSQAAVKLPTLKQTGMLSHIPSQDKDAELLSDAQTILDQSSLDEAMKKYGKLIKKGRLLDEVIHDLREAIYRYPVDVAVWQTLGDAYMRANRLQDALDSYTKAEELLR